MAERAVVLFAKDPRPGLVKKRLASSVGEQEAAALYKCFLLDTVEMLSSLSGVDLLVAWDGTTQSRGARGEIAGMCPAARFFPQRGTDLGERLENAFAHASEAGYSRIVAVGSDSPTLPPGRIQQALDQLGEADFVLGPTFDGGYYLIAGRSMKRATLSGIAWSTDRALIDTVDRLAGLGFRIGLLDPWYDVDDEADLRFLRSHLRALASAGAAIPCPRTFEMLQPLVHMVDDRDTRG